MKIFIDTSAFIALLKTEEKHHSKTTGQFKIYKQQRVIFITSYYILDELFTFILNRHDSYWAKKFLQYIEKAEDEGSLKVLQIDKVIFSKAKEIFIKFSDHKISFTDATTYVLYKEFAIDEVFTLDHDFKKMRLKTSF